MAGQEGFEPPTPGFGVRCSSRSSYWPAGIVLPLGAIASILHSAQSRMRVSGDFALASLRLSEVLFGLSMQSVMPTKAAIFTELQLIWSRPFVFGCCIVSPFTL